MTLKRSFKDALHFIRNPRRIYSAIWEELEGLDSKVEELDSTDDGNSLGTSVASGPGYTQNQLNNAFGDISSGLIPESFIGIYTNENDSKKYLVTVSDGEWKGILFAAIS
ncbi:hypothetical protein MBCUT_06800 [Methanobrevibacter cuticularis]|uniref:Uncharacterized protein n=1 Tax=Methanobrevibacter cuticularis TaxID=47311 RepID=A0A166EGW6_9EURY|nr:hypothetical protein [Methanobrevibacter cuticularis]KZX16642.1 hypothetical protein MBCUT_06800 [Methanobrevibacter cuticularis]